MSNHFAEIFRRIALGARHSHRLRGGAAQPSPSRREARVLCAPFMGEKTSRMGGLFVRLPKDNRFF